MPAGGDSNGSAGPATTAVAAPEAGAGSEARHAPARSQAMPASALTRAALERAGSWAQRRTYHHRDFSAGAGVVAFLFGSGIIVKPEFEQLTVADASGKHTCPQVAVFADRLQAPGTAGTIHPHTNDVAGDQPPAGVAHRRLESVDEDASAFDGGGRPGPRSQTRGIGEKLVETEAGIRRTGRPFTVRGRHAPYDKRRNRGIRRTLSFTNNFPRVRR